MKIEELEGLIAQAAGDNLVAHEQAIALLQDCDWNTLRSIAVNWSILFMKFEKGLDIPDQRLFQYYRSTVVIAIAARLVGLFAAPMRDEAAVRALVINAGTLHRSHKRLAGILRISSKDSSWHPFLLQILDQTGINWLATENMPLPPAA